MHLNGNKHKKRLRGSNSILQCPLCEIAVTGQAAWKSHLKGRKHTNRAREQGVPSKVEPQGAGATVKGHHFCATCHVYIRDDIWPSHFASEPHQRRLRFAAAVARFEEASRDKHGVSVSHSDGLDFGVLEIAEAAHGKQIALTISNSVPLSNIVLSDAKLFSAFSRKGSSFRVTFSGPVKVVHGMATPVSVDFSHSLRGIYNDRIELYFEDKKLGQKFAIIRSLRATVGEQAAYVALQPVAPFVPRKRTARAVERDSPIPDRMLPLLSNKSSIADTVTQLQDAFLPDQLNCKTYGRHYKTLLWAEEYRSDQDLQVYDIENTPLNRNAHGSLYYRSQPDPPLSLGVPGLAEKRPSVIVGDSILVQPTSFDPDAGQWFKGFVHVVHRDEVGMNLDASFRAGYSPHQRYRAHTAFNPKRLLFPDPPAVALPQLLSADDIKPSVHNPYIANNPPQLRAIATIVSLPPGSLPFCLFGPPGTGKTVSVVEAIRQLLDRNPNARIWACAPSNSAADLIALRLKDALTPRQLFRFYAPSRFRNQVPDELTDYSITNGNGHFTVPPMPVLKGYRVVVSTCVSASFAHGIGMPRGHFSHIFFDEAGHATEPEIMIGVKTMADNDTNISYFERLMERESHDIVAGSGATVVRLTQNFRSHPQILRFPNERFYDSVLEPCGDSRVINSYIGSSFLANRKFPIVFRALSGKDDREANSPSFFNAMEVLEVKACVEQLRSNREVRITDDDIGVIAPYHAQCLRIRASLKPIAEGVKVGSVETVANFSVPFTNHKQERRVIIISTVRSSREFVEYDLKHTLGFVANPRRLNVAVTHPLWRSFLNYIHQNGGWKGDEPHWDTSAPVDANTAYDQEAREAGLHDINEFARRMEQATMENIVHEDDDDDEDNTDRPWRELE
ncbi:P-loop containing nucleoside triphosphate hydrolase protein [Irpex lacteus]|nr:P-loop containing nucleoside triphosphate hydrolase protein [Irpex lacteus]